MNECVGCFPFLALKPSMCSIFHTGKHTDELVVKNLYRVTQTMQYLVYKFQHLTINHLIIQNYAIRLLYDFTILHRMMGMVSGATKFTGASIYHLLSTVNFEDFIYLCSRGYKINKIIKLSSKINSTESYTRLLDQKFYQNLDMV